jgi:hypothetical protein
MLPTTEDKLSYHAKRFIDRQGFAYRPKTSDLHFLQFPNEIGRL